VTPDALLQALLPRDADALARRMLLAEALQPPVALRRGHLGQRRRGPQPPVTPAEDATTGRVEGAP